MTYQPKRPPLDFCPIEAIVHMVGGRWKARLLDRLVAGEGRLTMLERALPEAPRQVLIEQLVAMERDGLVSITRRAIGRSPYRLYAATPLGHELHTQLRPLADWSVSKLRPGHTLGGLELA